MTDRTNSLTVVLADDMRMDDAEPLMNAIRLLRGVIGVKARVSNIDGYIAEVQARHEIHDRILRALNGVD